MDLSLPVQISLYSWNDIDQHYIINIIPSEKHQKDNENSFSPTEQLQTTTGAPKQQCQKQLDGKHSQKLEELPSNQCTQSIQIKPLEQYKMPYLVIFQRQTREKFKTFISLPKNRKNSLLRTNSSLQKKLYPENKQKIEEFTLTQQIRSFTKASESIFDQFQAHQVLESLLISSIALEKQNRQICIQKKDLLTAISLLLNNDANPSQNKKFIPLWRLLKDFRQPLHRFSPQNNTKTRPRKLKFQAGVMKLTYIPLAKPKKTLAMCSKLVQITYKYKQNEERSSHQYQIRRLRDSLLSQQNLLTNIKNCHRVKHFSRLEDRLEIPIQQSKPEANLAIDYMMQQNQLLMKVANQEFKKYESEIYEYGLLLQSKHLQIDLEYQEFSAKNEYDTSECVIQESIRSIVLNPQKADCIKYDEISIVFQTFLDKMRTKDTKLKKLIEIKSTFIAQFSSKMEFWIESLAFKKEFTQNLANYIEKLAEYSQETIGMLSRSLQDRNCPSVLGEMEKLRQSLEVFFTNLLNSHQFS